MSGRYYVDRPIASDLVTLSGSEAHHLLHVMRANVGVEIVLFDGSGDEFPARVERLERATVELSVLGRRSSDREPRREVTLGVALPKGDRQRWLVEKATELGVARLVPLETERSVVPPAEPTLARLRRAVIEASKQCGRNRLMEILPPQSWADYIAAAPRGCQRLIAQPGSKTLDLRELDGDDAAYLAVGPEGGLTDEEICAAIDGGWEAVGLGPRTLRIETAAILLAGLLTLGERA